jgi:hypothetical protein
MVTLVVVGGADVDDASDRRNSIESDPSFLPEDKISLG